MPGPLDPGFDTLALHAGAAPDPATGARITPLHLSTSFVFDSSADAAGLFNLERSGHVYSRLSNPTTAVFEERMAALEGGVGAIATASGQAALWLAIVTICGAGGHIVASSQLYGGSHNLLAYTLPRLGIQTSFVAPGDVDAWKAAIRPETRLLLGESLGNPGMEVLDIPAVSAVAHAAGLPLLVDATLATPWLQRPIEQGADLVMHSATKFLCGHGTVVGGVLIDSGRFDWLKSGKFPELTEPYAGFHGMVFAEESTVAAFLLRARREGLRDFGACMSPHTAWLLLQGLETLPLRMARHVANAQAVAEFLAAQKQVKAVGYPGLPNHASHARAQTLMPRGAGAVFSFELDGSRAQGQKFIESLKLFSHLANVGDARSLVIHPASTTHSRMDDAALVAAGIGPGTIRLSIGLEDPADLIADLKTALKAAFK
ncbi:O-acetylhomoserine aminocarboxypropyltransferase [Inhella proteolytica]|uniref:O-acetylhomoserine aminocarboxypropyltransferase n=1 Tax=Inhella proteolytica TaxID=2795029 RepID=A0A931J049_9BURK|nr:O-acetylhomoserine aminocarboxypropyltransferase [Inhella proteolytica]MBH9575665.1 O-acetylhomoserine aminocarboxypropyltransferase [Inhella proteolytica]